MLLHSCCISKVWTRLYWSFFLYLTGLRVVGRAGHPGTVFLDGVLSQAHRIVVNSILCLIPDLGQFSVLPGDCFTVEPLFSTTGKKSLEKRCRGFHIIQWGLTFYVLFLINSRINCLGILILSAKIFFTLTYKLACFYEWCLFIINKKGCTHEGRYPCRIS